MGNGHRKPSWLARSGSCPRPVPRTCQPRPRCSSPQTRPQVAGRCGSESCADVARSHVNRGEAKPCSSAIKMMAPRSALLCPPFTSSDLLYPTLPYPASHYCHLYPPVPSCTPCRSSTCHNTCAGFVNPRCGRHLKTSITHAAFSRMHLRTRACVSACTHAHTHARHARMHACRQGGTHTHTHTYKHACMHAHTHTLAEVVGKILADTAPVGDLLLCRSLLRIIGVAFNHRCCI